MTTTTIDEVIYCAESWIDLQLKWVKICDRVESENIIYDGREVEDGDAAVYLAHERYRKVLEAYRAQLDFEDKLEAQIAEEVAELMGDKA
jgi:hypothetical protein